MMEVKAYKWAGRRVISPRMKKVKVRVTGKVTAVKLFGNWCLQEKTSLKSWSVAHLVIQRGSTLVHSCQTGFHL